MLFGLHYDRLTQHYDRLTHVLQTIRIVCDIAVLVLEIVNDGFCLMVILELQK